MASRLGPMWLNRVQSLAVATPSARLSRFALLAKASASIVGTGNGTPGGIRCKRSGSSASSSNASGLPATV